MAERRWCLTGTPVQNQLDDLFSPTQFLRFHPLESHANARKYILEPLGRGDKTALTNLRMAMQEISLRRTKSVGKSKQRELVRIEVTLTPRERQYYQFVRDQVRHTASNNKNLQSHALLLCVMYLRQLCSHGEPNITSLSELLGGDGPSAKCYICSYCGNNVVVSPRCGYRQEYRTCGHQVCVECRLEEDYKRSQFSGLPECCICEEPIQSTLENGVEASEPSIESLLCFDDAAGSTPVPPSLVS